MQQYIDLMKDVLDNGKMVKTRTQSGLTAYRKTITCRQLRFDLAKGFPLVTTKRVFYRGVVEELIWFLNGDTNAKSLEEKGVYIWSDNAGPDGELGPIYGSQWRNYNGAGIDQIALSLNLAKFQPASTRNVVLAWNPVDHHRMKLPPCHWGFQVHVDPDKNMTLQASMRSSDVALGLPFNIASYATLAHLYAIVCGYNATELVMDLGNVHLYESHLENAQEQVGRTPYPSPILSVVGEVPDDLRGLDSRQFILNNYTYYPGLKYELIT